MKHIKSYENLEVQIPKLCKYLVWRDGEYKCDILENSNKIKWSGNQGEEPYKIIGVKHLYRYNFKTEKLEEVKPESSDRTTGLVVDMINESIKNLLYQSNNLQDCINTIRTMSTSNKYNL